MAEARRHGCTQINRHSSILKNKPYIDLRIFGAELNILVPEGEVLNMLMHGECRIYAVLPGTESFDTMASDTYARAEALENGSMHCQGYPDRKFPTSHLLGCPGTETSLIGGRECQSSESVHRVRHKRGKVCDPFSTHEREQNCCATGKMTEDDEFSLSDVMYVFAHKKNGQLSPQFSFLGGIYGWYRTLNQVPPLGSRITIKLQKDEESDWEKLIINAKPKIVYASIEAENRMTLGNFASRLKILDVRQVHYLHCDIGEIDQFSLDGMFNLLKVNRPRIDITVSVQDLTRSAELLPSVAQCLAFAEKVFGDEDFNQLSINMDFIGEIADPTSSFGAQVYSVFREDDDNGYTFQCKKQHVTIQFAYHEDENKTNFAVEAAIRFNSVLA